MTASPPQLRPLGVGEILDVSLKLAANNAATLARIVVFVVAPAQVLTNLVLVSADPDYRGGFEFGSTSSGGSSGAAVTATIVSLVIGFLAGQLATAASFKAVADAYLGRLPTWRESLGFAGRRFHSIIWVVILGGILTGLGVLLLIVGAIYLWVSFAVAVPVVLSEDKRGRAALGRAWRLVRGRWWKTFVLLFVGGLLAAIASGVAEALIASVLLIGTDNRLVVFVVATLAGIVGSLIATPFKAAYTTVLYIDLRVRKEAFDLQLLAEGIGVAPEPEAA